LCGQLRKGRKTEAVVGGAAKPGLIQDASILPFATTIARPQTTQSQANVLSFSRNANAISAMTPSQCLLYNAHLHQ